jgi:hypothetical protein
VLESSGVVDEVEGMLDGHWVGQDVAGGERFRLTAMTSLFLSIAYSSQSLPVLVRRRSLVPNMGGL